MNLIKNIIASVLEAIAAVFRYSTHRSELKNAPDIKRAKEMQNEVDKVNEIENAVAHKDTEKMRQILAE